MSRPYRVAATDIREAFADLMESAAAAEYETWCLDFYGPHTHTDTEPFRPTRSPWWPAVMDFPGLGGTGRFTAGSRAPIEEDAEDD